MSKTQLSRAQQALLDAINRGVRVSYMRYLGRHNPRAYYFREDTGKKCTAAAEVLVSRGLVRVVAIGWHGDHFLAAGKATQ